jgi:hypothetical protein
MGGEYSATATSRLVRLVCPYWIADSTAILGSSGTTLTFSKTISSEKIYPCSIKYLLSLPHAIITLKEVAILVFLIVLPEAPLAIAYTGDSISGVSLFSHLSPLPSYYAFVCSLGLLAIPFGPSCALGRIMIPSVVRRTRLCHQ